MKNKKSLKDFLNENPGYLKKSSKYIQENVFPKLSFEYIKKVLKEENKKVNKSNNKPVFKRLFWDIETSYNLVASWNIGYNLNIDHNSIIKERAIICISYKWAHENKVNTLTWNKGDDKQLLLDFIEIINSADESIGHNSDKFDLKWLRSRCLYHSIPMFPDYITTDTLKLARLGFRFNSNRLDYLGKFMGFGGKKDTGGFKLWQDIVERDDNKAMKQMVKYCEGDVLLLEKVYNRLNPYTKHKTHVGVVLGNPKCSCPNCGSLKTHSQGRAISAAGFEKVRMQCQKCGKYFRVNKTDYDNKENP